MSAFWLLVGWYAIVSLWMASHKVTDDNWRTVSPTSDLCLGVELAGTMKPEVMNILNPVSGFETLYAIKKHFALRGAVAQQLHGQAPQAHLSQ